MARAAKLVKHIPSLIAALVLLAAVCNTSAHAADSAAPPAANPHKHSLLGDYAYTSGNNPDDVSINITVSRKGNAFHLAFQASHPDGSGAAPDGDGDGKLDANGVFHFTFSDSFSNRGKGTFRRTAKGYELTIDITDVADPRCMPFYGTFTLRRAKPGGN